MSPAPARGGGRRLIVLRHGETGHNAAGIWQGQLDVPLSDVGVAQADAAGPAVAALSPSRIVTSDLARARRTADSVGRATGIRVAVDARFREIHAGAWQGLTADEVAQGWPELRAAALRGEDVRRGDDGETMGDVLVRVGEALDELLSDLPAGECAVVSTHGAASRAVASWVLDLDLAVAWRLLGGLGNCHWGELREGRHGWMLHTWNASSGVPSQAGSSPP